MYLINWGQLAAHRSNIADFYENGTITISTPTNLEVFLYATGVKQFGVLQCPSQYGGKRVTQASIRVNEIMLRTWLKVITKPS